MANPGPQPERGTDWLESVRALAASLLALVRTRAELFALEMAEGKERHMRLLVLAVVAALFLFLGLQLVAFLVIVAFWDTYRIPAIVGMTGLYLGIGAWAVLALRSRWRAIPPPFATFREELRKDLEALGRRDE